MFKKDSAENATTVPESCLMVQLKLTDGSLFGAASHELSAKVSAPGLLKLKRGHVAQSRSWNRSREELPALIDSWRLDVRTAHISNCTY